MKYKRVIYRFFLFSCSAVLIFGCVASEKYGQLRLAGSEMNIEQLLKHWEEYDVYWTGVESQSAAVLFGLKGDNKVITLHEYWVTVKDKSQLSEVIGLLQRAGASAALYKLMGPGNQVFGYIYKSTPSPSIRIVDEKTVWVDRITQ